jgi:peroxin-2
MTAKEILENAWEAASPKLAAIQNSLGLAQPPEQRVVRVGQLDAELLDKELAQVLQEPITKALSLASVCDLHKNSHLRTDQLLKHTLKARIEPELNLLVQLLLYKLSVWDSGGSYGAKLQDLRYVVPPAPNRSLARVFFLLSLIFRD